MDSDVYFFATIFISNSTESEIYYQYDVSRSLLLFVSPLQASAYIPNK